MFVQVYFYQYGILFAKFVYTYIHTKYISMNIGKYVCKYYLLNANFHKTQVLLVGTFLLLLFIYEQTDVVKNRIEETMFISTYHLRQQLYLKQLKQKYKVKMTCACCVVESLPRKRKVALIDLI